MARRLLDGCRRTFGEFVGDRVEPTAGVAVAIVVARLQVNALSARMYAPEAPANWSPIAFLFGFTRE